MSSYPPPPSSTTDGTAPTPDTPQQGADTDGHQAHSQSHPQFAADAAAAAAAVAAAHHGLQALQAAVAAPAQPVPSSSPVTLQTHVSLAEASYLAATDARPASASGANSKATRLRRACDMCSQRKVKVRALTPAFRVASSANQSPFRSATRRSHAAHAANSASTAPLPGQ